MFILGMSSLHIYSLNFSRTSLILFMVLAFLLKNNAACMVSV